MPESNYPGSNRESILTENVHVRELTPLLSPRDVKEIYPASDQSLETTLIGRQAIKSSLVEFNSYSKLVVITGPCSIHDPEAAIRYAEWLKEQREEYSQELEIVMRMYFEKPRTTTGWKGLINDPGLDYSFDINKGLLTARSLASKITHIGVPVGAELLDTITPHYFAGLVSWGAIGARTTESQLHRELASGLSFPTGFKNSRDGNIQNAVDSIVAANGEHHFQGINDQGEAVAVSTNGNPDTHVVLRGGYDGPNYGSEHIKTARELLGKVGLRSLIMVDASHANSGKDYRNQIKVVKDVAAQVAFGSSSILGVMIESNLREGSQPFIAGTKHDPELSVTDGCVGLNETADMFGILADSIKSRDA